MAAKSRPSLRQVLDEPVIDLLWPRAALMQLANTSIAPTEVESGAYGNRGAQRWQATMDYLRLIAGSDDESLAMLVREVNRVHATVRVPEGTTGGPPAHGPGSLGGDGQASSVIAGLRSGTR